MHFLFHAYGSIQPVSRVLGAIIVVDSVSGAKDPPAQSKVRSTAQDISSIGQWLTSEVDESSGLIPRGNKEAPCD